MKIGTFFSGVGSPEQALENLGIEHEIEFACDIDKYARRTYLKNFDCKNMYEDITSLDMKELSPVDLLVFGFPCQAFSMAGKRGGFEDTRGTLFYDALRYLKEHKPRYFIAENVKGLLSHDNGKTFQTIIDCLALTTNTQMSLMPFDNLGYHIHYKVLNTKDFGLPQNRERIFIVGIRDEEDNNFNFPKEIPLELKLKDILQDNNEYIKNVFCLDDRASEKFKSSMKNISPCLKSSRCNYRLDIEVDEKYYLSDKAIAKIKRHNNKSLDNELSNCIHAGYYKQGGRDQQYISHSLYPRSGDSTKGGTGHLSKSDGTAYCLDTGNAQAIEIKVIAPNRVRRLTPIECERLQGFPDNFTNGVSDTQRYRQMGNTITVNVIQAIFKNLLK